MIDYKTREDRMGRSEVDWVEVIVDGVYIVFITIIGVALLFGLMAVFPD